MTPKNILRTIKNPVVEKLARDNDRHVYKIKEMGWNTILLLEYNTIIGIETHRNV